MLPLCGNLQYYQELVSKDKSAIAVWISLFYNIFFIFHSPLALDAILKSSHLDVWGPLWPSVKYMLWLVYAGHCLWCILYKLTIISYFSTKRILWTPCFCDLVSRKRPNSCTGESGTAVCPLWDQALKLPTPTTFKTYLLNLLLHKDEYLVTLMTTDCICTLRTYRR